MNGLTHCWKLLVQTEMFCYVELKPFFQGMNPFSLSLKMFGRLLFLLFLLLLLLLLLLLIIIIIIIIIISIIIIIIVIVIVIVIVIIITEYI